MKKWLAIAISILVLCGSGFAQDTLYEDDDLKTPTAKAQEPFNPKLFYNASTRTRMAAGDSIYVNPLATGFPGIVLYVTALDSNGNAITGLSQNDFIVTEQSTNEAAPVTETITDFEENTGSDTNISFSLVFDLSSSMSGSRLDDAQEAANNFLLNARPRDRVSLVTFSSGGYERIVMPSDYVPTDADGNGVYDIIEAINQLNTGGSTAVYDGTAKGIESLSQEAKPKAVIVFTDGSTNDDDSYSINSVISKANNEGVPLYTIGLGIDPDNLKDMASATGGMYEYAPTAQDMANIYSDIAQSIRSQYEIRYTTHNTALDGTTRTVTVSANGADGTGVYVVNSKPFVTFDNATISLNNQSQAANAALTISGTVTDQDAQALAQALTGILFYRHINDANFTQMPLTLTDQGNGIFSFSLDIPFYAVQEPALQYYLYVTDGVQETYSPFNYNALPYSIAVLPNVAPDIIHTSITNASLNTPLDIAAQVTDSNAGDSVANVILYYRIHDPNQETPYIAVSMTSSDNVNYNAQIPADSITSAGFDYFISAWDSYNARRDAGSTQSPHFVQPATVQNPDGDDDGDGLTNMEEYLGEDGIAPGEEGDTNDGTNPTNHDTDGDGLWDNWEINGVTKGGEFLDLPALGADPLHKDLFVEIDYIEKTGDNAHSHNPPVAALDRVVEAFANAPVNNLDGNTGISLHYVVDQAISENSDNEEFDGFDDTFTGLRDQYFPDGVKRHVYRWCLFAHGQEGSTSSGLANFSDTFMITLGKWTKTSEQIIAGTFMHELGHPLGLMHGGGDDQNWKPNYLSIMSYSFQFDGLKRKEGEALPIGQGYVSGIMDYSVSALPSLDESALNEKTGISDNNHKTKILVDKSKQTSKWLKGTPPEINWNDKDNIEEAVVAVDLTDDGDTDDTLSGFDDWQNINYAGGMIGTAVSGADMPYTLEQPDHEETTYEEASQSIPGAIDAVSLSSYRNGIAIGFTGSEDNSISYRLFRGENQFDLQEIAIINDSKYPFFLDDTVVDGTTYNYAVSVINVFGNESDLSPVASVVAGDAMIDTDSDGLNDAWEIAYRFDPASNDYNGDGKPDGDDDPDLDGLSNTQEHENGTNPRVADDSDDGGSSGCFINSSADDSI